MTQHKIINLFFCLFNGNCGIYFFLSLRLKPLISCQVQHQWSHFTTTPKLRNETTVPFLYIGRKCGVCMFFKMWFFFFWRPVSTCSQSNLSVCHSWNGWKKEEKKKNPTTIFGAAPFSEGFSGNIPVKFNLKLSADRDAHRRFKRWSP